MCFLTFLCTNPYQKKPKKPKKSKNNENYEVFHKSTKYFNIQLGVEKYFFIFRFCFWPLFVTKNCIFMFFDNFIQKSLPKNPKFKKYRKLWGFSQKYKIFQYTTWGQKFFFIFRFSFWPLFVTKNGILVFFDHFMHKSLPKNLKFKKWRKLWIFSQKNKMFQYTTWSRKIFYNSQILFLTPFCNQKLYFWCFFLTILCSNPYQKA